MNEIHDRIAHWLGRIDTLLVAMLKNNSEYPTGDMIECEANLDMLTRRLAAGGLLGATPPNWWHGYPDVRIQEIVRAHRARGTEP